MAKKEFKYEIDKDFNYILSENPNTFIGMRKINWGMRDNNFKVDIRKYTVDQNGKEIMGKGVVLSDEAVDTMIPILLEKGYGRPDKIVEAIETRPDIKVEDNKLKPIFIEIQKDDDDNYYLPVLEEFIDY